MSARCITLQEWEVRRPDQGSLLEGVNFGVQMADRQLAEQLTRDRKVEIFELAKGVEIRSRSFVGRFRLAGIDVTIQPKLMGFPLLNLLRYAYGLRNLTMYEHVGFSVENCSFQDLIIHQLVAEVSEILTRGIHRDYVRVAADLASPRGRIDFNGYVRRDHKAKASLPCVHHPRIEDNILNQTILGGLGYASRLTTSVDLRAQINRLRKTINLDVSDKRLDAELLNAAGRILDRRTTVYVPALKIIKILMNSEGISLDSQTELRKFPGFLFDMNLFFQALISRFLRDHLSNVELHEEYRLKYMYSYVPGYNPRNVPAPPTPRPDFVVKRGKAMIAVLDAKYRDLWEKSLPREMLYQLSVYALSRPDEDRTAAILYPTIDSAAREQILSINEPLYGVGKARVVLRPVNLMKLNELIQKGKAGSAKRIEMANALVFGVQDSCLGG